MMERPEPRVLLATDGSEEAVRATRTALALADELGAELHVVHVGHLPPAFYESMGAVTLDRELEDRMRGRAEEEARTRLEEQVQSIAADGGKVAQAHARIGRPDAQIVGLAEELDADLIVVGSRGLGPLRRALMGSISTSVLHHAHTSVLVARGEPVSFPAKILVALDGSEEATAAVRVAARLASASGSELHVVYVGELMPVYHPERHSYLAQYDTIRDEARHLLDEQVEQLRAGGVQIAQAHLEVGYPDREIVAIAEGIGAGLVVVGSRGLGGMRRALVGSISDSVVRHAHGPVLVVRGEQDA
jgi:nucleotide-binding universal stress UspA family protein